MSPIGDRLTKRTGPFDERWRCTDIGMVAWREMPADRPADHVRDDVELGRPAASGYADRLIFRDFFGGVWIGC